MSETFFEAPKGWPEWAKKPVLWLGIPTGLILAVVALFGAVGQGGGMIYATCQAVHWCDEQKAVPPTPVLPNFVSSRVDGGHNFTKFCEPVAQSYRQQYPDFNITWREAGDGRDKDWLGHATYQYTCVFSATPKKKR